jgi:HlyD family secretion protein
MHAIRPTLTRDDERPPSGIAMDRALPQSPRWRRSLALIFAITVVGVTALLLAYRPPPMEVVRSPRLATAAIGEFVDEIALRTRVEPLQSVQLDAVEAGRVEAVFARDGARVAAGAPLYRLHSPEQEQLLMQRSAEVAQQLANVSIQRSAQAASLAQNRRELTELQSRQQEAESYYRRIASLPNKTVSAMAREEAERKHVLTTQLLKQAQEDHKIEAEIRQRSLDEMARAVEGLQRGLQMLERARERLQQHAPIAGRLTGFQLEVGRTVRPGDRLGRIDDASGGMQLVTDVDEYYLPRLRVGQTATSRGSGTLELTQTLPQVRDGKVRVLLRWTDDAAPPADLRAGQAIDVRLQLSESARALLVPDGPGVQTHLYVRRGNQLERRAVKIGRRAVGQVEILAGLRAGDEVLISQPPTDAERLALP